jgi:hypothetical protein
VCDVVAWALELELDDAARRRFAEHVVSGDGGPLFAVATGLLLRERVGRQVRAGDVAGLPGDLVAAWRDLYARLADRPHAQGLLHCLRFLHQIGCPLEVHLSQVLYREVLGHNLGEFHQAVETLTQGLWLRREDESFTGHDVSLEAVPDSRDLFQDFVQFALEGKEGEDLALGLLRASLSSYYWDGIPFTTTGSERKSLVSRAVDFGSRAIKDFRTAGHAPYLGTALSNTSNALSELAGLETTREGRARILAQAIDSIEEAIRIRRELGLQADIAMSLGTANLGYQALAESVEEVETQVRFLKQALGYGEEAVAIFRELGIVRYLALALHYLVITHLKLAENSGALDVAHVRALCVEGETLNDKMGDDDGRAFFQNVQQALAQTGTE